MSAQTNIARKFVCEAMIIPLDLDASDTLMVTMMQVLGYFELIIYIYIVCNRVFIELHDRTARKAYLLRCIFSRCSLLSRCNLLSQGGGKPTIIPLQVKF